MIRTTYKQIWSLYLKGSSLEASIETIQAITLSREEATPWLTRFTKDYADEQIKKALDSIDQAEDHFWSGSLD